MLEIYVGEDTYQVDRGFMAGSEQLKNRPETTRVKPRATRYDLGGEGEGHMGRSGVVSPQYW